MDFGKFLLENLIKRYVRFEFDGNNTIYLPDVTLRVFNYEDKQVVGLVYGTNIFAPVEGCRFKVIKCGSRKVIFVGIANDLGFVEIEDFKFEIGEEYGILLIFLPEGVGQ